MTTHFSYPNVIPRLSEFIGCGRYSVFPGDEPSISDYREITDTPNTPNKTALEHALQIIAPESFDSDYSIFEKKDQMNRVYQGDSLDLAYFLVHINQSRKIKIETRNDIWCTGVVQVFQSQPVLRKVDHVGFDIKLSHFLSEKCNDNLFIVPSANLTKLSNIKAENANADIRSLSQLKDNAGLVFNSRKTIIKVLPNELPELVNLVFNLQKSRSKKKFVLLPAILMICILGFLGWNFFIIPHSLPIPEEITTSLEMGDFDGALNLLKKLPKSNPVYREFKGLMEAPLNVNVKFQYRLAGQERPEFQTIDVLSQNKLTLSHRDYYRFRIKPLTPSQNLHVYVFQIDQAGNLDRLFPDQSLKSRNPIKFDQWPLNIPPGNDQWFFLDKLPEEINTRMNESIHILVSRWRAKDIEEYYDKFKKVFNNDQSRKHIDEFIKHVHSWNASGLPGIYYQPFSFSHSK